MKGKVMKKAFVFDFDDTLATTDCKVRVVRSGRGTGHMAHKKLTPAEFNSYQLAGDEEFDFSEFRSEKFIRKANPTYLMALAQEVYEENHSVFVLTARTDDVAGAIMDFLAECNVKPVKVFGVGSDSKKVDIAAEKQKVLSTLAQAFDLVYFYDDSEENCDLARGVGNGIKVYLV
jgi:phosphoserine phosphatase